MRTKNPLKDEGDAQPEYIAEKRNVKVISNLMVDIDTWVELTDEEKEEIGITEKVYFPVLSQLMSECEDDEVLKAELRKNIDDLIPKHITTEDIFASINYNMHLEYGIGCLLYTSPSPRDRTRSRMPSSA